MRFPRPHRHHLKWLSLAGVCAALIIPSATNASPVKKHPVHKKVNLLAFSPRLHNMLPASIKSSGVVNTGTAAGYPPWELIAPDGQTVIGVDPDLAAAVGKILGVKFKFVNAAFSTLIPAVQSGRYDVIWSDAGDQPAREQVVDLIDYVINNSAFLENANGPRIKTFGDVCGKKIAIQSGTTEVGFLAATATACQQAGKPAPQVSTFGDEQTAVLAVSSGRADATVANSATVGYIVKQSQRKFKETGPSYFTDVSAIIVPKGSAIAQPLFYALKRVMATSRYKQILAKWGVASAAMKYPIVNGGAKLTHDTQVVVKP